MLRTRLSAASTTGSARAAKTNHRCHLRNRSRRTAAGMGGNGLSVWRLPCDKGRTHTALMRYDTKKKKLGEFLFSFAGTTLQSFPPLKCNDFMKCVRELWNPPLEGCLQRRTPNNDGQDWHSLRKIMNAHRQSLWEFKVVWKAEQHQNWQVAVHTFDGSCENTYVNCTGDIKENLFYTGNKISRMQI